MIIVGTGQVTEKRIDDVRGTSQVITLGVVRGQLSLAEEVRYVVAFNTGKIKRVACASFEFDMGQHGAGFI